MAIVKDIRRISKINTSTSHTVLDYSENGDSFSIWTYKSGDVFREGSAPQNIMLPKDMASKLYTALGEFLKEI